MRISLPACRSLGVVALLLSPLAAFSQNPRPLQIAFGYYEASTGLTANDLSDALDAIQDYDTGWYWIDVEPALRDTAALDGLVAWVEAQTKMAIITSNDPLLKKCPECKKPKLRRLIGAGGAVMFKGTGFYQTDYRSEGYKQKAAADKPSDSSSSSSSSSSESKPAAKPKAEKKSD